MIYPLAWSLPISTLQLSITRPQMFDSLIDGVCGLRSSTNFGSFHFRLRISELVRATLIIVHPIFTVITKTQSL
jgi:hypothetical protein